MLTEDNHRQTDRQTIHYGKDSIMTANMNAAIEQAKADEKRGFVFAGTLLKKAPGDFSGEYIIPACVTRIGHQAFAGCKKLTSVVFPPSVKCIEFEAFASCEMLEKVIFSSGLTVIASGAFLGCGALKRADLPETLEVIGHEVFLGCGDLTGAALPQSLRKVCADAFGDSPVAEGMLAGVSEDKIIPADEQWEDREIFRFEYIDSDPEHRMGNSDGIMEWLPKYGDCDELVPYEMFLEPLLESGKEADDARLETFLKAHLDAMAKGGKKL